MSAFFRVTMRTAIAFILLFSAAAEAQFGDASKATKFSDVATVETSIVPKAAKPGEVVTVKLTIAPQLGWHTYPTAPVPDQDSKTTIKFNPNGGLIIVSPPVDPAGLKKKPGDSEQFYDDAVTFEFKAVVSPKAAAGKKSVTFEGSQITVCSEQCFPCKPSDIPPLEFEVLAGTALPVPAEYQAIVEKALGGGAVPAAPVEAKEKPHAGLIRKAAKPLAEYQADLDAISASLVKSDAVNPTTSGSGLIGLLTAAIFWGYVSLVTPCVFPMIPITVSLFLKKSHSTGGAVKLALVYCLTIIAVLGLSAVLLLGTFRELSVSPGMNIFLGLLFIIFALSLFGMYDIQLPGFLLRASEKRRAAGGLVGTVFGAVAFSIVSFTCVAPFLGGFAGLAATGNYSHFELVLAGLAFATAFASPFFVLAMFPSLLKKLPKSGGWLDTVKAVMGFLELAAAFKFFRTAELRRPPVEYFTYDVVLAAWVVIAIACGLYLLGLFRLPHDEEKQTLSVPRVIFALLFVGLGVYLMPGLFKASDGKSQRSGGVVFAWVEAFLLPEPVDDMPWSADLKGAIDAARKGGPKYVFVDFTGVTCTNCRYNEQHIFPIPSIQEALSKYRLVQMYTDDVPAEFYLNPPPIAERKREANANVPFQMKHFGTEQLPLYVILEPLADGKVRVAGVYAEGKINDKEAFAEFLRKPLAGR